MYYQSISVDIVEVVEVYVPLVCSHICYVFDYDGHGNPILTLIHHF